MNKKIIIALVALGGTLTIAALCLMMPLQQSVAQQTAHVIHALVLPPGATSATDTVKILPNGTAVVIVPTHANYTKTLAANQTFTIAPQESVTGGFALPPNISNV